jgi:hypothetical protein
MPLSNRINVHKLLAGKKYLIEVQWNLTNTVRNDQPTISTGIFVENIYVRGRTRSFDSGLQVLTSRPRIETVFNRDGCNHAVSSTNKFYEILTPKSIDFVSVYSIYRLPLPFVLKREIRYFVGNQNKLYYKKRSNLQIHAIKQSNESNMKYNNQKICI